MISASKKLTAVIIIHMISGRCRGWVTFVGTEHAQSGYQALFPSTIHKNLRMRLDIYLTFIEYHCVLYILCDGNFFCMLYVQQVSISVVLSKLDTVKVGTCGYSLDFQNGLHLLFHTFKLCCTLLYQCNQKEK